MSAIVTQAAPTTTETQDFTSSGLGTPVGAIALGSNLTTINGVLSDTGVSIGATDLTTEGACWGADEDNQTTTDNAHIHNSTHLVHLGTAGASSADESAEENNAVTDGIQLNWDAASVAKQVSLMLLQEGINDIDFRNYDLGTGTDTITVGFQADIIVVFSTSVADDSGQNNAQQLVTFYERSSGNYVAAGYRYNNGRDLSTVDTQTADVIYTTDVPCTVNEVGSVSDRFTIGNFTSTAFDVVRTQGSATRRVGILSIELDTGYNAYVDTVNAPTSQGNTDLITSLTGTPVWGLWLGTSNTTVTGSVGSSFCFGMMTANEDASVVAWSEDAATGNSNCGLQHRNDSSIMVSSDSGSMISRAAQNSFSDGTVSMNFSVAVTAVELGYLVVTGPSSVNVSHHHEGLFV